jgi:streptogramin lyase
MKAMGGAIYSMAIDPLGNIYEADFGGNVRKLNPAGTEIWKIYEGGKQFSGIVLDKKGYIYFGLYNGNTLRKYRQI